MKNVLKIWLGDNTVTVDNKDDKIGQLESSGNLTLEDVLDEMHKKVLREVIAQTSVSILGERQSVMYVAGFSPATATAGRLFTVNGRMLKVVGTDPK